MVVTLVAETKGGWFISSCSRWTGTKTVTLEDILWTPPHALTLTKADMATAATWWQGGYIGPLPPRKGRRFVLTAVDAYSL